MAFDRMMSRQHPSPIGAVAIGIPKETKESKKMSTVTSLHVHHPRKAHPAEPTQFDWLRAVAARIVVAWQRRKTERMLEALPSEIRKDIGWPTIISK
jgi:hypothetical protein